MTAGRDVVAALLAAGQVTAEDLRSLAAAGPERPCPTHSEFVEAVEVACPPASLRTYQTTFRRLDAAFGVLRLDAVRTADLEQLAAGIRRAAQARGHEDGSGAVRGFIHGSRFFYRTAMRHGHLVANPAMELTMPPRRRNARRALTEAELADVWTVVGGTGHDPVLDLLLLDLHRETAARRGGAIGLRLRDIDPVRGSFLVREKGGHQREVPASGDLLRRVLSLAHARGARAPDDPALRFRDGSPVSRRRYNSIFDRVQRRLPWAANLGVSIHWLRHTTLTDVSNAAGPRIAAAYAGHLDRSVTDIYTTPSFEDLRAAHTLIFGE